jgi:aromatic-L-amino-acid decarboxylase
MTPEEFRAAGHELIDWIADYRQRLPELPVPAQVSPGDVARALPADPPAGGEPVENLLADLDRIVVPGLTQVQHPRYFGWFPANAAWPRCSATSPPPGWARSASPGSPPPR